jgi:hypothetical protein
MVAFESALERDCITFLARLPGFWSIEGQPISVSFELQGGQRRYTPDFRVVFDDLPAILFELGFESETFVEVKYADQAAAERLLIEARLAAVCPRGMPGTSLRIPRSSCIAILGAATRTR